MYCGAKDSTPIDTTLCDSCAKHLNSWGLGTMFASKQQPTNKAIDAKRAVEKERLEKCRNALLDLVQEGKLYGISSINDVFGILNQEIEARR